MPRKKPEPTKQASPPQGQGQIKTLTSLLVLAVATWLASTKAGITVNFNAWPAVAGQCRSFPGDRSWPTAQDWETLNNTVGGRLIATIPIGAVCHDTFPGINYDAEKCAEVRDLWPKPELHEFTTHSTMAGFWANMSCDPFTLRDAPCSVGAYVQYAVNAAGAEDYRKTIAFADKHNIRLIYFPGGRIEELERLLHPTFTTLKESSIQYAFAPKENPNFQEAFLALNPYQNVTEFNIGGRLIPTSSVTDNESVSDLADAIKLITTNGGIFAGVSADLSSPPPIPNSAHPAPYDRSSIKTNAASQKLITEVLMPRLEALTPGGGAYLNETDINQPNWQEAFYGANYARLLRIKKKYDPSGIL
ncbi:isoamyl alcohol oxidase [Cladorrhinum sp. PSN332]|nr:isoamyl alcohol oxidase [Cladorrhinum sp. PSN332]